MNGNGKQHDRFNEYFETYADAIFRHLLFKVSDRERAKELTQEVFVRLWQTMQKGEEIEHPKALLYKIAHNLYINEWRDRKDMVYFEDVGEDVKEQTSDLEKIMLEQEADSIIKIFEELPPQYKEILTLRYVDDYDVSEIADILNISTNVASVRIHRALRSLRRIIEKHERK